tara:strand:- start:1132 stop:1335 length:204 start_codon:yes stop_codon:yes gene_type:complete
MSSNFSFARAFNWQSFIKRINVVIARIIVAAIKIFMQQLVVVQKLDLFFGGGGGEVTFFGAASYGLS